MNQQNAQTEQSEMPASPSPGDAARQIISDSTYPEIRRLSAAFGNGVLTLSGQLPSFYLKQIVLSAVRNIAGVERIEHRIEVV